jgi:hypothetical protein
MNFTEIITAKDFETQDMQVNTHEGKTFLLPNSQESCAV